MDFLVAMWVAWSCKEGHWVEVSTALQWMEHQHPEPIPEWLLVLVKAWVEASEGDRNKHRKSLDKYLRKGLSW